MYDDYSHLPEFGEDFLFLKELEDTNYLETVDHFQKRTKKQHLWRVLDDRDIFILKTQKRLTARADHNRVQYLSRYSLTKHVRFGSKNTSETCSSFISTSLNLKWNFWYIRRKQHLKGVGKCLPSNEHCTWYPFVRINLERLSDNVRILDISEENQCKKLLDYKQSMYNMAKNFAISAKEVIILGDIHENALEKYQLDPATKRGNLGQRFPQVSGNVTINKFSDYKHYSDSFDHVFLSPHENLEKFIAECSCAADENLLWPYPDKRSQENIDQTYSKSKHDSRSSKVLCKGQPNAKGKKAPESVPILKSCPLSVTIIIFHLPLPILLPYSCHFCTHKAE